jgi:hypothetical protein
VIKQIFLDARDIIAKGWCQKAYGRKNGVATGWNDDCDSMCMSGAFRRAFYQYFQKNKIVPPPDIVPYLHNINDFLTKEVGFPCIMYGWNDSLPEATGQAEVIKMFEKLAESC